MLSTALSVSFICLLYSFYSSLTIASSVRFIYSVYVYFYFICLSFCLFVYFILFFIYLLNRIINLFVCLFTSSRICLFFIYFFTHKSPQKKKIKKKWLSQKHLWVVSRFPFRSHVQYINHFSWGYNYLRWTRALKNCCDFPLKVQGTCEKNQ